MKKIGPRGGERPCTPKSTNDYRIFLEYKLAGEVLRDQTTEHTSKGSSLDLKPRADITLNPKQSRRWPTKKTNGP